MEHVIGAATQDAGRFVVEWFAVVVDRRRWHAGLDQLDPPTIHDLMIIRRRDSNSPTEVMSDPQTHTNILPQPTSTMILVDDNP